MDKYIIAIDLDDTLLNDKSEITSYTKDVIGRLIEVGHIIVIATGRPYLGALYYYKQLGLNTPLVIDNGSSVFNPTDTNFPPLYKTIDISIIKELFIKVRPIIFSGLYSVKGKSYIYNRSKRLDIFMHISDDNPPIEGPFNITCDIPPHGILFIVHANKSLEFEEIIKKYPTLNTRNWGRDKKNAIYEVYIKNSNKADGLKHILKYYDINPSKLIAFGDGINDFEMIEFANLGVAMINGNDLLKEKANYITKHSNDEDGVAKYLENLF